MPRDIRRRRFFRPLPPEAWPTWLAPLMKGLRPRRDRCRLCGRPYVMPNSDTCYGCNPE